MEIVALLIKELGVPLVLRLIQAGANAPNSPLPTKMRDKLTEIIGDRIESEDALQKALDAGGTVR